MNLYIGLTDRTWFNNLRYLTELDEVNFWIPGRRITFPRVEKGELFLFKLHSPNNFIGGGGICADKNILPVSLAWDTFGTSNGAADVLELRRLIEQYRGPECDFEWEDGCRI